MTEEVRNTTVPEEELEEEGERKPLPMIPILLLLALLVVGLGAGVKITKVQHDAARRQGTTTVNALQMMNPALLATDKQAAAQTSLKNLVKGWVVYVVLTDKEGTAIVSSNDAKLADMKKLDVTTLEKDHATVSSHPVDDNANVEARGLITNDAGDVIGGIRVGVSYSGK